MCDAIKTSFYDSEHLGHRTATPWKITGATALETLACICNEGLTSCEQLLGMGGEYRAELGLPQPHHCSRELQTKGVSPPGTRKQSWELMCFMASPPPAEPPLLPRHNQNSNKLQRFSMESRVSAVLSCVDIKEPL